MILTPDPMEIHLMQEKACKAVARVLQRQDSYHKLLVKKEEIIVSLRCLKMINEILVEPLLINMQKEINSEKLR